MFQAQVAASRSGGVAERPELLDQNLDADNDKKRRKRNKKKKKTKSKSKTSSDDDSSDDDDEVVLGKLAGNMVNSALISPNLTENVASKAVAQNYFSNHMGDPVDMTADEVVMKVNSTTPNLAQPVTKAFVQDVIARMWEQGEKYDVTAEIVKKVKHELQLKSVQAGGAPAAPVVLIPATAPVPAFSPTITPSHQKSGGKKSSSQAATSTSSATVTSDENTDGYISVSPAKPSQSGLTSSALNSGEAISSLTASLRGLSAASVGALQGLTSSAIAPAVVAPGPSTNSATQAAVGSSRRTLPTPLDTGAANHHHLLVGRDMMVPSTPPGIPVPASPMATAILAEKLEAYAASADMYEAVSKLCSWLAIEFSSPRDGVAPSTHTERVRTLLDSKALEILFQQVFSDNIFFQRADCSSALASLLQQIFFVPLSATSLEAGASMTQAAVNDVISALVGLSSQLASLRVHCKQTFVVGPLAVGRAIAAVIRKTFIRVVQQQALVANTSKANPAANAIEDGIASASSQAVVVEEELQNAEVELSALEAAIAKNQRTSSSDAPETTLASVLELRELQADKFGIHLKLIGDAKRLKNLVASLKHSTMLAVATHKPVESKVTAVPETTSQQGGYADLLVQGLLADCGETQASITSKTMHNRNNISAQVEALQVERHAQISPWHQRIEGYSERVAELMEKHAALTAQLATIAADVDKLNGMKSQALREIETVDQQYQAKMSRLEAANHVSLAAYQVKDTVNNVVQDMSALEKIVSDAVGVGSGVHSTHLHEQRKAKDTEQLRTHQAELERWTNLDRSLEVSLKSRSEEVGSSLAGFVSAQGQCISHLSRRVKLSSTKLSHVRGELAAYQKLGLPHMVTESEASISSLEAHLVEDREVIAQLQGEVVGNILAVSALGLAKEGKPVTLPVVELASIADSVAQAGLPVATEISAIVAKLPKPQPVTSAPAAVNLGRPDTTPGAKEPRKQEPKTVAKVETKQDATANGGKGKEQGGRSRPEPTSTQAAVVPDIGTSDASKASGKPRRGRDAATTVADASKPVAPAESSQTDTSTAVAQDKKRGERSSSGRQSRSKGSTATDAATPAAPVKVEPTDVLQMLNKRNMNTLTKQEADKAPPTTTLSLVARPTENTNSGSRRSKPSVGAPSSAVSAVWKSADASSTGSSSKSAVSSFRAIQEEQDRLEAQRQAAKAAALKEAEKAAKTADTKANADATTESIAEKDTSSSHPPSDPVEERAIESTATAAEPTSEPASEQAPEALEKRQRKQRK